MIYDKFIVGGITFALEEREGSKGAYNCVTMSYNGKCVILGFDTKLYTRLKIFMEVK